MKKRIRILGIFLLGMAFIMPAHATADEEIIIGTGSKDGVYYYAGKAMCRIVNTKTEGINCKTIPTAGSLYNLSNVKDGGLDLGIAQSDWQYHAVQGTGPMKYMDGSFGNLRSLFSLHAEAFTLVVRRDSGITEFDDIPGHRVNIGNPGSGQRGTMDVVMNAMGWSKKDFQLVEELNASEQSFSLCNNRIQAMVYTVGHPNASVAKAVKLCDAALVSVTGPVIDKLVTENPFYAYTTIPGNIYTGITNPVNTFGVTATVVASSDLSTDTVYKIVSAIFDNLEAFKKLHPAFNRLEPQNMVHDGISAELHDGAKKYFKEKGWL